MAFNFVANTAALLSLASSAIDAGQKGKSKASKNARCEVAIKDIKTYEGDSTLNYSSQKHNEMKKMVSNSDFLTGFYKAKGAISGFFGGATESAAKNLPSIGFAAFTLGTKNKTLKTIGLTGTLLSMVIDFIKNGTNLFAKKNVIEK